MAGHRDGDVGHHYGTVVADMRAAVPGAVVLWRAAARQSGPQPGSGRSPHQHGHVLRSMTTVAGARGRLAAPDRPSAVAVALAVVVGALNAEDPHVGRRAEIAITAMIPTVMPMRKKTDKMMAISAAAFIVPPSRRPRE